MARFGILCVALAVLMHGGIADADVPAQGIRLAADGEQARLVVDLAGPAEYQAFVLAGPDRLVVDLKGVVWRLQTPLPGSLGAVVRVRTGQFNTDTARLVLDLAEPMGIRDIDLLPPTGGASYRLVLDFAVGVAAPIPATRGVVVAAREASVATIATAPAPPVVTSVPPLPADKPHAFKPMIVIDAGHGGDDPGAIAAGGLFEKDITLAAARELARLLNATGRYEARLSRNGDEFLSLGERVVAARRGGADLFISLHCDALDDSRVRGSTIYTLSETASDEEARRLAAKENLADDAGGVDLVAASYDALTADILIDLTRRDTMNASARFAVLMGREVGQVAVLRRNSHRFAGFKVLKAPDVPSVLFEMGYLSNQKDLAMLSSRAGRKPLLGAVVTAIDRYFEQVTAYR